MNAITLPVSKPVTTGLLVVGDEPVEHPRRLAIELLQRMTHSPRASVAQSAMQLLASSVLRVHRQHPAILSPWREVLADIAAEDPEDLIKVAQARYHIGVSGTELPTQQPAHAKAGRLVAVTLAEHIHGLAVDMFLNSAMPARWAANIDSWFRPADWFTVFITADPQNELLRATSRGLARFGLPDLCCTAVPFNAAVAAITLLRAAAYRLLADHWRWILLHPDADERVLSDTLRVTTTDLLRFHGSEVPAATITPQTNVNGAKGHLNIRLRPVRTADRPTGLSVNHPVFTYLMTVVPARSRSDELWWRNVAAVLLGPRADDGGQGEPFSS